MSYRVLCSPAPTLGTGSSLRDPEYAARGSMFHPIDTGPFKLVVLRPTDSIKAHPQSRYSKPGRAYPMASSTQFSVAHRPLSTLSDIGPAYEIATPAPHRLCRMRGYAILTAARSAVA
jgi:hypothetical protein